MPLSRDPGARAAQLANLKPGGGAGDRGLQRARKHGVYAGIAERELDAKVRTVYDAISADVPVHDADGSLPAADSIVVRVLAESLVRRERVRESELRHGIETPDGRMRGIVEFGLRLDGQIVRLCEQLGLTPRARAALGLDLARIERARPGDVSALIEAMSVEDDEG